MNGAWAIFKKELRLYFSTTIAYLGFGSYAFLMGILFLTTLGRYQGAAELAVANQTPELLAKLNFNDSILVPIFSTGLWMFLFFVPFLTMRLFAEERSSRTFELLMTSPIGSTAMVVGKFFAALAMIAIFVAVPLVYPIILTTFGSSAGGPVVEWSPIVAGTLISLLMGAFFVSIGLLASACTQTQIVSALVTFACLLFTFLMPFLAARVEGSWNTILRYLTPMSHVHQALLGHLRLENFVYFLSVTGVLLFVSTRVIESYRWRT